MKTQIPIHAALTELDQLLTDVILLTYQGGPFNLVLESSKEAWTKKAKDKMREIFVDSEPFFRFTQALDLKPTSEGINRHLDISQQATVIADLYRELERYAVTPLHFVAATARIHHFDRICPLAPNSKEAGLAQYMFSKHDFEEPVDADDIYSELMGAEPDFRDRTKVIIWAREINRKTNEKFGFPIFTTSRGEIALTYPLSVQNTPKLNAIKTKNKQK